MGESPPPEAEYWKASTRPHSCGVVLANVINIGRNFLPGWRELSGKYIAEEVYYERKV